MLVVFLFNCKVNFLGDKFRPLIIIDTPGLNDVNDVKAKQHRLDLQAKLSAMGHIDMVLIILGRQSIGGGARFLKSTFEMIGDIITVFGGNEHLYDHFGIGFSCCDNGNTVWRQNFPQNSQQWQNELQSEFGFGKRNNNNNNHNNKIDQSDIKNNNDDEKKKEKGDEKENKQKEIPMFKLSNVQYAPKWEKQGNDRWSRYKDFEKLYLSCVEAQKTPLISTDRLLISKMKDKIEEIQNVKQFKHKNKYTIDKYYD